MTPTEEKNTGRELLVELLMAFLVCTACICILEGIIGILFSPEQKFGYEAFFSPPFFGICSVLFGLVTKSRRELSVKEIVFRRILHLALVEILVFGLNYIAGNRFETGLDIVLAVSIAVIFLMVYAILYINDKRNALQFNEQLKTFQERERNVQNTADDKEK